MDSINNSPDGGKGSKIYFPNLNAIRFIAALLVIIHHIEQLKTFFGIESYWGKVKLINVIGPQGVTLFFVLSGFLITYLLLAEEHQSNTISVKKFYFRRILRIWPLYMLVVLSSLFILPYITCLNLPNFGPEVTQTHLWLKLALYLTFFANLVLSLIGIVPFAAQTWSIGTEEQFYLVWPVVLKKIKNNRIGLMIGIVLLYDLVKLALASSHSEFLPYRTVLTAFVGGFSIDCMAIGGLFAVLLFTKSKFLSLFLNNYSFYFALFTIILSYSIGLHIPLIHTFYYSSLYGIFILNLAANPHLGFSLEHRIPNYLGNISYGIYMLHPLAITIVIKIGIELNIISNYLLYPLSIGLSILLASISYRYFESFFLKFKEKFQIVKSGN